MLFMMLEASARSVLLCSTGVALLGSTLALWLFVNRFRRQKLTSNCPPEQSDTVEAACDIIPGLRLFRRVVPDELQHRLVSLVDELLIAGRQGLLPGNTYSPIPPKFSRRNQSREMLQFGVYTHSNRVDSTLVAPIPSEIHELLNILVAEGVISPSQRPNACTVNAYAEGNWLPPHIDSTSFARPFVTVSLVSEQDSLFGRNMSCSVVDGNNVSITGEEVRVAMPVGSALRLDGDAADVYEHAVPPATCRRISLTLRRLSSKSTDEHKEAMSKKAATRLARSERKKAKKLAKKLVKQRARLSRQQQQQQEQRRTQLKGNDEGAKSYPIPDHLLPASEDGVGASRTPAVELEHVQRVYDTIAPHWHGTRYQAWPKVAAFIESLPSGSLIGDLGCGNGKNLPACNKRGFGIGCDISGALAEIASSRPGHEAAVSDILRLSFRDNSFDAVLCIAVLHHLSTPARRERALRESIRVLKPGGQALFYAWAFEQEGGASGHRFAGTDTTFVCPPHLSTDGVT